MPSRAACDRCHELRAKCIASNFSASCCRCYRLNHQCSRTRTRGRPGRKRKCTNTDPAGPQPHQIDGPVASFPDKERDHGVMPLFSDTVENPCAQPRAWHWASIRASIESDHQLGLHFTVVSGMVYILGMHVQKCLQDGPPILLETYLALRHTFHVVQEGQRALSDASLSTNAKALQTLRNACLQSSKDTIHFLWLTAFVQSFDRLSRGTLSTNAIFECSLTRLQDVEAQLTENPHNTSASLTCCIFADTAASIMKSCVPIMKIPSTFEGLVDRYVGLCGSLLPLLYDVCCLLAATKNFGPRYAVNRDLANQWSKTCAAVIAWQPSCSSVSFIQLSPVDQTVLLSQAHAYRATAILTLDQIRPLMTEHPHYPRYHLGYVDRGDGSPVDIILVQTRICLDLTAEPPPLTNLPLIVAALESTGASVRDELTSILESSRGIKQSGCIYQLKRTLASFWTAKEQGLGTNWLKSLGQLAVFNALP